MEHLTEKTILESLAKNRFVLTLHAMNERMPQRNVRRADIIECARTAKKCIHDSKRNTYKVVGLDLEGIELTVVVGFDRDIIVITVF